MTAPEPNYPNQPTPQHGYGGHPAPPGTPVSGYQPPQAQPYPYPYQPAAPASTNGKAIGSLVCGILGLTACVIVGIVGIVIGKQARQEIAQTGQQGDGMARAGIILGWVAVGFNILIIAIYAVIFTVAASNGAFSN